MKLGEVVEYKKENYQVYNTSAPFIKIRSLDEKQKNGTKSLIIWIESGKYCVS